MSPTRREFLASSSALMGAAALGLSPAALAQSLREDGNPPTLVVVYLRGGADALNAVIPAGDQDYYTVRPTIAVPTPGNATENNPGVIPVTNMFGFHPSLAPLHELYEAERMTAIVNAGSTHPTRSHFDAQDFMERAAPGVKSITEGWLNRFLSATRTNEDRDLRAVSLQSTLPRSLRGEYPVLAVPGYGADDAMRAFEDMYACDGNAEARDGEAEMTDEGPRVGGGPATIEERDHANERQLEIITAGAETIEKLRRLQRIVRGGRPDIYPNGGLGNQLADVAKVIKAGVGLEVAALDYGGWDHHAYQGGSTGTFANMLSHVSQSVRAFHDDLGPLMDKTVVLVMSEFGRTVRENGNNGTDHGHGGFMMAVGGPVKGNRLYGSYNGLNRRDLYQGRDLPVSVDFRSVFAESLFALYGFNSDQHQFFPDYEANEHRVGFLNPVAG
ncbi:DUF1501 domain-containing protein [Phycisphaeraceae bacterium D3-23]